MGFGDSLTGGELPEEPEGHSEGDDAGAAQRGWLAPEDRLWRHPSEVGRLGMPPILPPLFDSRQDRRQRRRARRASLVAGVMGAAALATVAAVVLTAFDSDTTSSTTGLGPSNASRATVSTTAMTTRMSAAIGPDVMRLVSSVRPSLVGLEPTGSQKPARMTGVVLPGGDLVVTAAAAIAGRSQLDVVTSDGKRHRGKVMGSDARAGVAVIRTGGGLSPATFADETVQPDDLVVAACLCTDTTTSASLAAPAAAVGMVRQVGTGVSVDGGPVLVNSIEAETPLGPMSWGGVLLDGRGRVIGILDGRTDAGNDTLGVFVPAPLAEGVALELATTHHVEHGWLGVVCTDGATVGATVASIMPGSPAAGAGIVPGDVVVAVGPHPVSSFADLQERLYTVPPGSRVQLLVEHGSNSTIMTVKLAGTPDS